MASAYFISSFWLNSTKQNSLQITFYLFFFFFKYSWSVKGKMEQ